MELLETLTLHYALLTNGGIDKSVAPKDSQLNVSTTAILRLEALTTSGWVGLGFSNDGNMIGSEAVLASSEIEPGTYLLEGKTLTDVYLDPNGTLASSISDVSFVVEDGKSVLTYTTSSPDGAPINSGDTFFMVAAFHPTNPVLSYHGFKSRKVRLFVRMSTSDDFEAKGDIVLTSRVHSFVGT